MDQFESFLNENKEKEQKARKPNPRRDAFIDKVVQEAKARYVEPRKVKAALKKYFSLPEVVQRMEDYENLAFYNFVPRPDDPANFDQQHSFCFSRDSMSFLIGGNAAGTTEASAYKTALFVLQQQPPPRRDTPFWILSNTYSQVCWTCWHEKLLGHGHIPKSEIDWDRISWYDRAKGWPERVPLKPWPGLPGKNWCLEFKSYDQGRASMQARSIGGFWFSEQFPAEVFLEVFRGCREYMFKGGQFAEFTPIDPVLCVWVEKIMETKNAEDAEYADVKARLDKKLESGELNEESYKFALMREDNRKLKDWGFYRANTRSNVKNLAEGWFDQFFASVSDEMLATRMTGALATFEGAIYPTFSRAVHTIDPCGLPPGACHYRAIDWGSSKEHPFVCVWGCVDAEGVWTIYDEYWSTAQDKTIDDHVNEIKARSRAWGYPEDYAYNAYYGPVFADPSRPDNIAYFNRENVWIEPAVNDVFNGIECVRVHLKCNPTTREPKIRIFRTCGHLIDEMRTYQWMRSKKPTEGGVLNPTAAKPAPLKRNDDTVDALRYMLFSYELQQGANKPSEASYKNNSEWQEAIWGR